MKHISQRQSGMTALGIFIIIAMVGCFVGFGLRLFPLYTTHEGVKGAMNAVIKQPPVMRNSLKKMRTIFIKNAKINGLYDFDRHNIKDYMKIKKSKDGKIKYLTFNYEESRPLFKNYHLMIKIDEALEIPKGQAE